MLRSTTCAPHRQKTLTAAHPAVKLPQARTEKDAPPHCKRLFAALLRARGCLRTPVALAAAATASPFPSRTAAGPVAACAAYCSSTGVLPSSLSTHSYVALLAQVRLNPNPTESPAAHHTIQLPEMSRAPLPSMHASVRRTAGCQWLSACPSCSGWRSRCCLPASHTRCRLLLTV